MLVHAEASHTERRSPLLWASVLLLIWVAAFGVRMAINYAIFPLWWRIDPGRALGYWLLYTPLAGIAAAVRHFFLYIPDCAAAFACAALVPILLPRHWVQFTIFFAFAFFSVSHLAGGFPTGYVVSALRSDRVALAVRMGAFTALILVCVPIGALLGARWGARGRRRAHQCRHCDYDLRGLPRNVCPECGHEFVPLPAEAILAVAPDVSSSTRLRPARSPVPWRSACRFALAAFLLALFYLLDWSGVQVFLRDILGALFRLLGFTVQHPVYDGVPGIGINERGYRITAHCTLADLMLIVAVCCWRISGTLRRNLGIVGAVLGTISVINVGRVTLAFLLNAHGVPWAFAHDLPYLVIYSTILVTVVREGLYDDGYSMVRVGTAGASVQSPPGA
jgi:hypothetical protein